jgi:hypothetical protein
MMCQHNTTAELSRLIEQLTMRACYDVSRHNAERSHATVIRWLSKVMM